MKASLRVLRLAAFVVIAPVIGIVMGFMFVMPMNVDWWFSGKRREEALDVWRKLWNWVQGPSDSDT